MIKLKYAFLIASTGLLGSCNNASKTSVKQPADSIAKKIAADSTILAPVQLEADNYQKETSNETKAKDLAVFLQHYLKEDIKDMAASDRTFSFYELDLNGDDKNEYFIKLPEKFFCGSGGCTFLLLDDSFKVINRFTVTNPPIYIGSAGIDGWKTLILQGQSTDKFVHLKWDSKKKKYPSNPSLIKESAEAPAKESYIMWQDNTKAKTIKF